MSTPSRVTRPVVGSRSPESRLRVVVLPAPFGPMMAKISPSWTSNDRSLTAARPPKRRPRPSALSMVLAILRTSRPAVAGSRLPPREALEQADQAARHEEYGHHQNHAVGHHVAVRQHPLERLLHAGEHAGGEDGAHGGVETAEYRRDQRQHRGVHREGDVQ